jgi:hypothetical protein
MVGGGKEALKFLDAEDLREALAIGAGRKVELHHGPAEGIDIAEADGSGDDVTRTPGQPAFDEQVMEIAANLLGRTVRWGAFVPTTSLACADQIFPRRIAAFRVQETKGGGTLRTRKPLL